MTARWIAVAAIVVLASACGANGSSRDTTSVAGSEVGSTPGSAAVAADDVDRTAAIAAAIDVRAAGCGPRVGFGTGSVIGNGDVVTVAHVVAGSSSVEVIDVDGQRSNATVILFDADLDLAVLRPTTPVGTPFGVRGSEARVNETGVIVLPRLGGGDMEVEVVDVRVTRTVNIETTDIYLASDVVRPGYEIEGSIDPGDSGAMVVLPGGGAGIVWARSSINAQRAWAIDLPTSVRDGSALASDPVAVDVGECTAPRPG